MPPKNDAAWDAGGGIGAGAALLQRIAHGEGLSRAAMVELRGLEPLTSSMPSTDGVPTYWHPRPRTVRGRTLRTPAERSGW